MLAKDEAPLVMVKTRMLEDKVAVEIVAKLTLLNWLNSS